MGFEFTPMKMRPLCTTRILVIVLTILVIGCNVGGQRSWFYRKQYADFPDSNFYEYSGRYPSYGGILKFERPLQCISKCSINPLLLEYHEIYDTRQENEQCSAVSTSCHYEYFSKYRTADGSCNNLRYPSWGKANNCLRRILPYDYADGFSAPRISCQGRDLPNPRVVSNVFHKENEILNADFTTHFMEWGQLLAHDFSLNDVFKTLESGGNMVVNCCLSNTPVTDKCFAAQVPPDDPTYPRCLNIIRTVPCPLCTKGQRQHWNQNTAYHDLSLVYGSNEDDSRQLRTGYGGMMKVQNTRKAGPLPPAVEMEELCVSPNYTRMCFKTGDTRGNQNIWIATLHTMFLRHHNNLCEKLQTINPYWDDETIFQEARRIAIAQAQMITFGHYLPLVLGPEIMAEDELSVLPGSWYTKYDPTLDASIIDEFTTVAHRYGHSLVPNRISEIDPHTGARDNVFLRNYFYNPFDFYHGQFDKLALGMTKDLHRRHDPELADDVRDFLYRRVYMGEGLGLDLAALSVARGRDHGIPGYSYYVKYFFNTTVSSFCDLKKLVTARGINLLQKLYSSVHDIDLYTAGLAEFDVKGGFVGPTFAAILRTQYKRTKFGDRFYFEHGHEAGSFTPEQLVELKKTTLASIICDTTNIEKVQQNVFYPPSYNNPVIDCDLIPQLDLVYWKE